MVQTAEMLLEVAEWIGRELKISLEFVNIGGGLGIPYRPEDTPLALEDMSAGIYKAFTAFKARNGYGPKLFMESGRNIFRMCSAFSIKTSTAGEDLDRK